MSSSYDIICTQRDNQKVFISTGIKDEVGYMQRKRVVCTVYLPHYDEAIAPYIRGWALIAPNQVKEVFYQGPRGYDEWSDEEY